MKRAAAGFKCANIDHCEPSSRAQGSLEQGRKSRPSPRGDIAPEPESSEQVESHRAKGLRVLIAYYHSDCTVRIDQLLPTGFNIVGVIYETGAIVQTAVSLRPDVVLVDVSLPLHNGFKTIKSIRRLLPDTAIVFHTLCTEAFFRTILPAMGAAFVTDPKVLEGMAAGITLGLSRGRRGAKQPHGGTAVSVEDLGQPPSPSLTEREGEVLALLAGGYRMKEIAYRLSISYHTVTFHKYRLMRKLGIHSDAALVSIALRRNIVDDNAEVGLR